MINRNHLYCLPALMLAMIVLGAVPVTAADPTGGGIPEVTIEEVEQALVLAGSNRAELEQALDYCRQKPYTMAAMRFVIASLPLADLGVITGDELIEHVELAMQARAEMKYGMDYDDAIWAHYVLPPRVSQEPLSPWRPYFYHELRDLVADCETLQDAAIIVDQWCGERTGFKQTQRRDQGPLVTLKSGFGRCEELMMVQVCAMRSVGIPARNSYCPWWAHCDNNHAWTEVYCSDGKWHMADSGSLVGFKGTSWVTPTATGAPIICSMCFGLPTDPGAEMVSYKDAIGARYAQVNSIDAYRTTGRLHFDLSSVLTGQAELPEIDERGEPIEYTVYVHVFNYGALRPVAKVQLDSALQAGIELGVGRYVLSTNVPVANPVIWVDVVEGIDEAVSWATAPPLGNELILEYPRTSAE